MYFRFQGRFLLIDTPSVDVSANFMFNEKVTAGLAWRWDDSISALLGFQITRELYLGFAYDLTSSNYS
ncbi:type IX secretion system membrane protein PorP/SprF, partial [Tenacibaculum piscium]|uniref:type IX secretion system membrane protein PorP/SprF n=1 Tax=Tenacibaculum piscium TaxID=1458515 RepID=UPI00293E532E